jgi:DNA-binding transcriptional regulator YdaS (Cro superfamily)
MKTQTAIDYFGSKIRIAQALDLSAAAITKWGDVVPELRALQLERITQGELVAYEISPTQYDGIKRGVTLKKKRRRRKAG